MLYPWGVGFAKKVVHPLKSPLFSCKKVTSRKIKKLWTKGPEWSNAAYEEKEKSHYFTHPAQGTTSSHPHFNQRERMETWEKEKTNTRSKKKINRRKKTGGNLKRKIN